jgi:O-succinylbenzoic acid--CoA ligase
VPRLVALDLAGGPEFVDQLQRAWETGDAVMPIDTRLSATAKARLLEAMQPEEPTEPGDALVMVTSGTTGEPKGVVLAHAAVEASARATNARLGVDPATDAWWACLPVAHIGGLSVITRCLVAAVRFEAVARFTVDGATGALARGATMTSLVPTTLARLGPHLSDRFKRVVLGGQAPPLELPPNVVSTYGMTETGSGIVYDGVPLDGVEVRISVAGEIEVRGPSLLRAYRDGFDPKSRDGWLSTGDGGEIGSDGRLHVRGRLAEMIISGGENVWPLAVERILRGDTDVEDVAVVGLPDPEWGQRVTAFVVTRGDAAAPDRLLGRLRDLVSSQLAAYAAPRQVVIVASLPVTALGKVRKDGLDPGAGPTARL